MSGRIWVITGTNSGIGLAIARHCLLQGDKVIATVRSLSKFPDVLRQGGAHPLVLDMSNSDEDIRKAAEEALGIYGHVDVLVNNAGTGISALLEEQSMKDIRYQFQVNVFAHFAFTQPFITHFRTRRTGHIVNISSMASLAPFPGMGAYCSTKAALDQFTDTLSMELSLFNVRVISVLPGYFVTGFFGDNPLYVDDKKATRENESKLSEAHNDPATQDRDDVINAFPRLHHEKGLGGDPDKLAARLYEVVMGTGMAQGLVPEQGGKREWTRVVLGADSGEAVLHKLELLTENVKVFESMWRSTNMDPNQVKDQSKL